MLRCEGDGYLDIVDPETGGVVGPRPCPGCPDCTGAASEDVDVDDDTWLGYAEARLAER